MRGTELGTRIHPAILTPQPLSVDQVRARQFGAEPCAPEALDRAAIKSLRVRRGRHERPSACLDAEDPSSTTHSSGTLL